MVCDLLVEVFGLEMGVLPDFKLILSQVKNIPDLIYSWEILQATSVDEYNTGLFLLCVVDDLQLHHVVSLNILSMRGGAIDDEPKSAPSRSLGR